MLTPLDIQNKTFKKKFSGYSKADVDEFFSLVCEAYDKLYTENVPADREDHSIMTIAPQEDTVVVSSACYKHHDSRHFFSHSSESWKSKVKVPAW